MNKSLTKLISESLLLPDDALVYEVSREMADRFSGDFVLETEAYDFELIRYAEAGKCSLHLLDRTHAQLQVEWLADEREIRVRSRNAFYEILWRGKRLHCLWITYGDCEIERSYLVAPDEETARAFFAAVCAWSSEVSGEILVYSHGVWQRDKALHAKIQEASFDSLVLPGNLREELIADFEGFFSAEALYRAHGVAWKRGILLLGPPGNGKTHCVKAMLNRLQRPVLYVQSLRAARKTGHQCIAEVFKRARETAPCVLVFEDLDSMIDNANRAFFLNEMDGFGVNHGVLTVATTNHPERLDPALINRPSRFDRKITFPLPAKPERRRFLEIANERREPCAQLSPAELKAVAKATDGFSFAYLKELGVSSLMAWMRNPVPGAMGSVMLHCATLLRSEMSSERPTRRPADDESD